jgi:hypothetical protein
VVRRITALGVTALAAGTLAAGAGGAPATTEPVQIVAFNVVLTDRAIRMQYHSVGFENAVAFRVRNRSAHNRTLSVGSARYVVRAKGYRAFELFFESRGVYPVISRGPKGSKPLRTVLRIV